MQQSDQTPDVLEANASNPEVSHPVASNVAEAMENPNLRWAALVPAVCLIAVVVTAIKMLSPEPNMKWGGVSLLSPIRSSQPHISADEMVFETNRETAVRAAIGGSIVLKPDEHALQIRSGPVTVAYSGMTQIKVKDGDLVQRGESLGSVDPDLKSRGTLVLKVFRQGTCLRPTAALLH